MNGLMYKNGKLFFRKKEVIPMVFTMIIILIAGCVFLGAMIMPIIIILFYIVTMTIIYQSETNKFIEYEAILPITKKNKVKAKYYTCLLYMIFGIIIAFVLGMIANVFTVTMLLSEVLVITILFGSSVIISMALVFPILYKYKSCNRINVTMFSLLFIEVIMLIIIMLFSFDTSVPLVSLLFSENYYTLTYLIPTIICSITVFISMKVSERVY